MARFRRRSSGPAAGGSYFEGSSFEESIRVLRSSLDVALTDLEHPRVIFTSALPGEGKTTLCAHTAIAFAAAGRRTVLVDLDLRRPYAHRLVGAHNEFGATDALLRKRPLEEVMQYVEVANPSGGTRHGLWVLSAGGAVSNPAEVLGSGRTLRILDSLASQADLVLVDTPPVLPVADTLVIGRITSGALLVTAARSTAIPAVQKAKDLLVRNQTRLLGIVLNRFDEGDEAAHYRYGPPAEAEPGQPEPEVAAEPESRPPGPPAPGADESLALDPGR